MWYKAMVGFEHVNARIVCKIEVCEGETVCCNCIRKCGNEFRRVIDAIENGHHVIVMDNINEWIGNRGRG